MARRGLTQSRLSLAWALYNDGPRSKGLRFSQFLVNEYDVTLPRGPSGEDLFYSHNHHLVYQAVSATLMQEAA